LFNEGTGPLHNLVTGNPATLVNAPVWGAGPQGAMLNFVPTNSYAVDLSFVIPTAAISIVLGINQSNSGVNGNAFGNHNGINGGPYQPECEAYITYGGTVYWRFGQELTYTPPGSFYDSWHNMAFVSGDQLQGIYIDNVLEATRLPGAVRTATTPGFDIGAWISSNLGVSNGANQISYLHLYNRCLSQTEVSYLNEEPYAMIAPPNIRRFYSFGNASTYTQTINDNEGIADAVSEAATYQRAVNDNEGVTDSVQGGSVFTYTINDNEGVTDATIPGWVAIINDNEGVTDSVSRATTYQRTVFGNAGVTDSQAMTNIFSRAVNDSEGVTDAATGYDSSMSATVLIELLCSGDVV
jgi:hypothetical protein